MRSFEVGDEVQLKRTIAQISLSSKEGEKRTYYPKGSKAVVIRVNYFEGYTDITLNFGDKQFQFILKDRQMPKYLWRL